MYSLDHFLIVPNIKVASCSDSRYFSVVEYLKAITLK